MSKFQSTRPRGARQLLSTRRPSPDVSIHAPTRGATHDRRKMLSRLVVSIHAPTRGATFYNLSVYFVELFQSTRPRGARPTDSSCAANANKFQSTRPRGARQFNNLCMVLLLVSIHAPTRGATTITALHAAVKGFNPRAHAGRDGSTKDLDYMYQFQSTRPRGARRLQLHFSASIFVSIHAPTRGATLINIITGAMERFNPRAHAGRDVRIIKMNSTEVFQSTRPRGARLVLFAAFSVQIVSIHAPTRGATVGIRSSTSPLMFQSTRPRGARPGFKYEQSPRNSVSIHAPTRGATWRISAICLRTWFQSTRPRGARHRRRQEHRRIPGFNPRAHAGRDTLSALSL